MSLDRRLAIDAIATGAAFHEEVRVFAPGWVTLPGDAERWPQNVRLDGAAAPVVARNGRPALWIQDDGEFAITGSVPWSRLPDGLPVPIDAGIVTLSVSGQAVGDPEFAVGFLRLGAPPPAATEADSLEVRVHRKLTDSLPGRLDTRLTLQVAGAAREEYFGPLLPKGFVPTGLQTALPARLEADGRLRVQVRPGTWTVELAAHAPAALNTIAVPAATNATGGEIWSFAGVDRLRVAALEGAAAIDPAQANVPAEWQSLPAYHVEPKNELRIVERSRGLAGQDLNKLVVQRDLWRDFATRGYTFHDHVSGEMQQGWRLDMTTPYELQGARSAEQPLLVTRGAAANSTGVEWRAQNVNLIATGRALPAAGQLPASGWTARIASLAVTLHLPPGYRLLAAAGADRAPSAWLDRWRLLDIFVVLLVVTAAFRVAGVTAAIVAGAALLLAHHEARPLTWLFLNLLIAMAIARAVPEGRFRVWAQWWRNAAFALVIVMLVPFTLTQARSAFFPQLEAPSLPPSFGLGAGAGRESRRPGELYAEAPASAEDAMAPATNEAGDTATSNAVAPAAPEKSTVASPMSNATAARPAPVRVEPFYAPGTVLQSGPGVPQWQYGSHRLEWSGPVEATQSLRLVVLGPWVVSTWRLLACLLLVLLFVLLLRESYEHPRWAVIERWLPRPKRTGPAPVALLALLPVLAGGLLLVPQTARAEPSAAILEELKQRLLRPPPCAPACIALSSATVRAASDTTLEIELEAHAQSRAVLTLPAAPRHWNVDSVRIDGNETATLGRDDAGRLIVGLDTGVHNVTLRGRLAAADSVRIAFPQRPARVRIDAGDWVVTGVDEGRLLADSITLTRRAAPASDAGSPAECR